MPDNIYPHGHHESVLRSHRWRTAANSAGYLLPHIRPGLNLLDVGCGPGTITVDLARLVDPGEVTAVEITEEALDLARAEASRQHQHNINFVTADINALHFANETFDIVHAHQVLQYLSDPVHALREMGRVCRPGGIVAVRDSDYRGFAWFPLLPELDDWLRLYETAARDNGGEPDAGRRLLSWARRAGFTDVAASSSTWCFANDRDRHWWGSMWADRILQSDLARELVRNGHADTARLESISRAWRVWAAAEDGWFSVHHGEILCKCPADAYPFARSSSNFS